VVTRRGNATDMWSQATYLKPSAMPLRRQGSGCVLNGCSFQDGPGRHYSGEGGAQTDPCLMNGRRAR